MRKPRRYVAVGMLCLCMFTVLCPSSARAQRVEGLDVSEYQGAINWATAYGQGVRFAFIRSCRGGPLGAGYVDANFHANMAHSSDVSVAGQPVTIYTGNYHFARPDTIVVPPDTTTLEQLQAVIADHARSEAAFFHGNISPYLTPGHLRPVLDLEIAGPSFGRTFLSYWANSFLDHFESLSGVEPLIYCNTNYATSYFDATLSGRDVWIANWSTPNNSQARNPPTGVFPTWAFWQYSSPNGLGPLHGVSSVDIDLNVARGDMTYLQ